MVGSAEKLADWLATKKRFANQGTTARLPPRSFEDVVAGQSGIIFFANYWRRAGQHTGPGTGDHIDLWDGSGLTNGFMSLLRFTLGIDSIGMPFSDENWYSDLHQSSEIRFWRVP